MRASMGTNNKQNDALKTEQFYLDPWQRMRETSSEYPQTERFTESLRGSMPPSINMDGGAGEPSLDLRNKNSVHLPTRPVSSGGATTSALEIIGRDYKHTMDVIQSLRHLGLENSVPLPKIVVVGDQSTGKSSVIEGISGIKVPRSSGTCTRCPLEINLAESQNKWQCKVYLSRRYSYLPDLYNHSVTKNRPYGPWEPIAEGSHEWPFAVLHYKDALMRTLNLAQLAVLNPSKDPEIYKPENSLSPPQTMQVEFSPNVVRLDISGPRLPDLAFYDLPGMISHVGSENQNTMPKLIENLVKDYIRPSNTIILLTLTMNHDIQNSKTAGFINRVKSEDKSMKADDRTVGVFTKPDLITADSETLFESIFDGQQFRRKLGYFVVLNNHDPSVDHAMARSQEATFFQTWHKKFPKLEQFKDRFGTLKLQEDLSRLLADKIHESLPSIRGQIETKIAECQSRLDSLPRPPSGNLSLEISQSLSMFKRNLESVIKPALGTSDFSDKFRQLIRMHRSKIIDSYPRLRLLTNTLELSLRNSSSPLHSRPPTDLIEIDDDDEEEATTAAPSRISGSNTNPQKRPGDSNEPQSAAKRSRQDETSANTGDGNARIFTFEEVRNIMVSQDDTGLPSTQNPQVTKEIFLQSINHWQHATSDFVNGASNLVGQTIVNLARNAFQNKQNTELWSRINKMIRNHVMDWFRQSGKFAATCLRMEHSVFTMDNAIIQPTRRSIQEDMMRERRVDLMSLQIQEELAHGKNIAEGAKLNRLNQARTGPVPNLRPDPYQAEIEQMALTRAYYQYAANRYAEYVTLNVRIDAVEKCANELCQHIEEELHLNDENANEYIGSLLEVDQGTANERVAWESKLKMFNEGLEKLTVELESHSSARGRNCETPSTVW